MQITRRHLQVSLGALWLLDGVLQCQPIMFSRGFSRQILAPAGVGRPSALVEPLRVVEALVSAHPALANSTFVLIQILLGVGLLTRRFSRASLAVSIVWSLSVWMVGEGLGGLATGATLLAGAPGAAVLYAVVAILAWPSRTLRGNERPSWLVLPAWCALWLVGAGLQLLHGNNSSTSFTMMLRAAQSGAPSWIGQIDRHVGMLRIPSWTAAGVIAIYVLVAIWALVPGWTRQLSIGIGVFISLTGWLLFQGLGDLTSGRATDPNSGPLMVLLALAVVGAFSRNIEKQPREVSAPSEPLRGGVLVSMSP